MQYTSLSRTQWIELAGRFYTRLRQDFDAFAPSDWERITPYMGWRCRDLLAHMASDTIVLFRPVLEPALAGDSSALPEFNTFVRNAREVARRRTLPVTDVLSEFWSEMDSFLAIYRGMSDDDWLKPAWFFVGPVNVRTLFLALLADNVFHERDYLLITGRWKGLEPEASEPLVDWFMREVRPAFFRPERAAGLRATAVYRLTGAVGGEWTMEIADGHCAVEPRSTPNPDVIVEAETENLVAAVHARAAPIIGRLARLMDWVGGANHREDVVAAITGYASALPALLSGRIRVSGDRALANRINTCFWQFWERTRQTESNIARDRGTAGRA